MYYKTTYHSPIGDILIVSDHESIVGVWFYGQKYFCGRLKEEMIEKDTAVLSECKAWLDDYFHDLQPEISRRPLHPMGSEFRLEVWNILKEIPYGETMTYKDVSKEYAKRTGKASMSSQAIGGAVGHNPISIIIPCHRVIGVKGNLTGYAGGMDKKIALLHHEHADEKQLFIINTSKNKRGKSICF